MSPHRNIASDRDTSTPGSTRQSIAITPPHPAPPRAPMAMRQDATANMSSMPHAFISRIIVIEGIEKHGREPDARIPPPRSRVATPDGQRTGAPNSLSHGRKRVREDAGAHAWPRHEPARTGTLTRVTKSPGSPASSTSPSRVLRDSRQRPDKCEQYNSQQARRNSRPGTVLHAMTPAVEFRYLVACAMLDPSRVVGASRDKTVPGAS